MREVIAHSRPTLDKDDRDCVSRVIKSGQIAQGQIVGEFERRLASFIGMKGAAATSSGTSALHLALLALGVAKGDEIIIPSYVCSALLNAVNYTGARPVLADIDSLDFNILAAEVKKKIGRRTKAVIIPHMFGTPAGVDEISKLDIPIIEDCAQSIGAKLRGRRVGGFGALCILSLYATKMLTTGEGGVVLSNNEELLAKIMDLREYDEKKDYLIRYNYKMTDMQAALGLNQLKRLGKFIQKRREIAGRYNSYFSELEIQLPFVGEGRKPIFYRYVIRVKTDVEKTLMALRRKGIVCKRPVYLPLHRYLGLDDFPNASQVWKSAISVPLYPSLSEEEIERIIQGVSEVFSGG